MDIEKLLESSVAQHASDLHIIPGLPPMVRVYGDLLAMKEATILDAESAKNIIYGAMTPDQQRIFEKNLVTEFALSYPKIGNFRVSVFHHLNGISAVFRVIPEKIPTMDELSFPPVFKTLLSLSHGLILMAGATGSGKSTTLASMVDYINTNYASHIITIEDPIEYIHNPKKSAINQLQIGRDTPSMEIALRAALRQDPNVILLGEIRDLPTIRLALTAAETGHLVLATLHASTAPMTISRIVDIFPTSEKNRVRNLLAETLQAVICQTLVKNIKGGRVAAFEIMLANPAIRHLIHQGMMTHMESTMQTSGDIGMCTLDQYLQKLQAKQLISSATAKSTNAKRGPFDHLS